MPVISSRETRIGQAILAAFLVLIGAPYVLAALLLPENQVWGGLLYSADDQNVHLMWARQARDGAFFFRDLFTTESLISGEKPLFFNFLAWCIGVFSRFSGLEVGVWYHVLRVAFGALAIWQLHRLAIAVTEGRARWENARIAALIFGAFTTGAGVLAAFFPPQFFFPDFFLYPPPPPGVPAPGFPAMPEAFLLLSALFYPLNIASYALLAFLWTQILRGEKPIFAFLGALLLSNIHTYDALPLLAALLVWAALKRRVSRVDIGVLIGAVLPILYQLWVFRSSSEFQIKALTPTPAPALHYLVLAFLPLLVFAILALKKRRELPQTGALWVWLILNFALIYAPVSFARKMIEGAQIPLLVLAGIGFASLSLPRKKWLFAALVLVLAVSPLRFLATTNQNFLENNSQRFGVFMPPLFLSRGEKAALDFLDSQPQGAVLCLPFLGSYVPRATGKFTYFGHWAETLNVKEKMPRATRYFSGGMDEAQAREFLRANRISYVIESAYEKSLSPGGSPSERSNLREIWRAPTGDVVVYSTGF